MAEEEKETSKEIKPVTEVEPAGRSREEQYTCSQCGAEVVPIEGVTMMNRSTTWTLCDLEFVSHQLMHQF